VPIKAPKRKASPPISVPLSASSFILHRLNNGSSCTPGIAQLEGRDYRRLKSPGTVTGYLSAFFIRNSERSSAVTAATANDWRNTASNTL
jgi:hypothetical protein